MEKIVFDCLMEANRNNCTTIALPALGTGYQKFPPDVTATHMLNAVKSFAEKVQNPNLKEVKLVIFGGSPCRSKLEQVLHLQRLSPLIFVIIVLD